jgi:elongation factor Ts
MSQDYVRDTSLTIADVLNSLVAKIGENISIARFTRYQIGA